MQSGYCVVFFLMVVSIAAFLGDLTTISDCLGYSLNSHSFHSDDKNCSSLQVPGLYSLLNIKAKF